jgi:hypothetical protein
MCLPTLRSLVWLQRCVNKQNPLLPPSNQRFNAKIRLLSSWAQRIHSLMISATSEKAGIALQKRPASNDEISARGESV